MKNNKVFACFVLILFGGSVMAMNFNDTLRDHDPDKVSAPSSTSNQAKADEKEAESASAKIDNGTAYVSVSTSLNIRTGPWGKIIGWFHNNDKVNIIGRQGDWYKISHNGKTAFIHSRYVSAKKNGGGSSSAGDSSALAAVPGSGNMQQKLVNAARNLVTKYSTSGSFPYHPLTKNGSLGCAQVVTTALMNAGVNTGQQLGVRATIPKLKALGWKEVRVPPYRSGDVITWATYDSSGDGVNDSDSHIGIIMESGNSVQAMSNSSSRKRPSIHSATYMPVSRVLRKV